MEPQQQPQQPQQQQLSVDELFKTIGELTVQLRVANSMIMQLQQEKVKLETEAKKAVEGGNQSI